MNVHELIEILKEYPQETEIEMGIIAPVTEVDQIAVDRYPIEGVLPWEDEDDTDGDGTEPVLWLIGGEEDDVEAFLDAIEDEDVVDEDLVLEQDVVDDEPDLGE
jgi:hypothetical protein